MTCAEVEKALKSGRFRGVLKALLAHLDGCDCCSELAFGCFDSGRDCL